MTLQAMTNAELTAEFERLTDDRDALDAKAKEVRAEQAKRLRDEIATLQEAVGRAKR